MDIRQACPEDAEELLHLIQQVEAESSFMLFEEGERNTSVEQQRERIWAMKKEGSSTLIVAEEEGRLVGYLAAINGSAKRQQHSLHLVVGILKGYRGKGLGTKLFTYLEKWAIEHRIHRLELTVVVENEAGLGLYKKMGFKVEGTKKHSLLIDEHLVDEYYMAKLL
ncbi:GNAT family N-acetyltransferase [Halobacillus amylolyticus]|uniref:GNAT family N-acetyltransferase n=1 Tax=Halobacillus amylolyticus TaxID=2932259 RepID=A0ABY4H6F5_9BACI|nr:GNAT family N-acetyltransferase [Halobacillus amylolyticus]UOR10434.1 GNAT family N-acetyltransferase [Halobacillus amylolyticus]